MGEEGGDGEAEEERRGEEAYRGEKGSLPSAPSISPLLLRSPSPPLPRPLPPPILLEEAVLEVLTFPLPRQRSQATGAAPPSVPAPRQPRQGLRTTRETSFTHPRAASSNSSQRIAVASAPLAVAGLGGGAAGEGDVLAVCRRRRRCVVVESDAADEFDEVVGVSSSAMPPSARAAPRGGDACRCTLACREREATEDGPSGRGDAEKKGLASSIAFFFSSFPPWRLSSRRFLPSFNCSSEGAIEPSVVEVPWWYDLEIVYDDAIEREIGKRRKREKCVV